MNHTNEDYPMNYKKPDALKILTSLIEHIKLDPYPKVAPLTTHRYRDILGSPTGLGVLIPDNLYPTIEDINRGSINKLPIEALIQHQDYHRYIPLYFHQNKELLFNCQKTIELNPSPEANRKLNQLRSNILITTELFNNLLRAKSGG